MTSVQNQPIAATADAVADETSSNARLNLPDAPRAKDSLLDGSWWPRTRDLTQEIPQLATAFADRGERITRVVYNPDLWQLAPTKLRLAGRPVHLGWFHEIDPNLISLRTSAGERIELVAIPPETPAAQADRAAQLAVEARNALSPTALLSAAGDTTGAVA